ncbi:MAG TPA: histidine kinase [Glycomyces sp.]|nr:histidine kinase [Glycomyces sp.]
MTESPGASAAAAPTVGRRLDDLPARFRASGTFARDAVLALAAAAATFGLFALMIRLVPADPAVDLPPAEAAAITAIACGQALLLCLRRLRPVLCFAAVAACQAAIVALAPDLTANGIGPAVAAYTLGSVAALGLTIALTGAAALATSAAAAAATWGQDDMPVVVVHHLSSNALMFAAAAFIGVHVAARRRGAAAERERAAEAMRAQRERAEAAIVAERTRIARELHDVAAHHLSGMVVQAAAVERLIARDAEAAGAGAAWIRSQGKATLENLRQVVGLLRESDTDGNAPVPGVSALPALVAEARRLGDDVDFEQTGEPLRLPPIADISLYRIAQQSLTNARQHAPGANVRVLLAYGERSVALEVVNGPAARGGSAAVGRGGAGLIGMRERADLVGADFAAGPAGEGWRVALKLTVRDVERRAEDVEFETGDRA